MTVGGLPAWSSWRENERPRRGGTPSRGRTPSVTRSTLTRSGSAVPVTLAAPSVHRPTSWNVRPSSRYVKYREGAMSRSVMLTPGAVCQTPTSSSECG